MMSGAVPADRLEDMERRLGRTPVVATCLALVAVLAGCGGTSNSSSSKPAVCTDVDNVKASVQSLRDVSVGQGALTKIQGDLATIRQQLATLKADAKTQFAADTSKLQSAVDTLSANVSAAKADPSATTLSAVGTAVAGVADAMKGLASATSSTC